MNVLCRVSALLVSLFLSCAVSANNIGIIGSGAAGLTSAWMLESEHDITLYEARDRLGGHADTVDVNINGKIAHVEAGAEFFNTLNFPHFLKLLEQFNVKTEKFSLVATFYSKDNKDKIILPPYHDGKVEWGSLSPKNLTRLLKMKSIIDRAHPVITNHLNKESLEHFVEAKEHSDFFLNGFFYPYIAAAYGVSNDMVHGFSAYNALYYVYNGQKVPGYKWLEVPEGLSSYIKLVADDLHRTKIKLSTKVTNITHERGLYQVYDNQGGMNEFDTLIVTANAEASGYLIQHIKGREDLANTLKGMPYYDTEIAIHGDASYMPANKKDWRVVNTVFNNGESAMTIYKSWHSDVPVFKSWLISGANKSFGKNASLPNPLYALIHYRHPVLSAEFAESRDKVNAQQGIDNLWFGGMWTTDVDSHESAIVSAIKIARVLSPNSARLHLID